MILEGEMAMREKQKQDVSRSILITAVLFLLFVTAFDLSKSYGDVIDQQWERPHSSCDWRGYSVKNNYPLGQEFTAGKNNITGVELSMLFAGYPPLGIATVDVAIRDGTVQGQTLASGTNTFEITATMSETWLYFDFGGPVSLSVGNHYTIEASMPSGSEFWCWNAWNDADGIGLPGRLTFGSAYSDTYAFGFRTYAIPEPGTILLLGLGTAILRKKKLNCKS
jgi:hypothetical protein